MDRVPAQHRDHRKLMRTGPTRQLHHIKVLLLTHLAKKGVRIILWFAIESIPNRNTYLGLSHRPTTLYLHCIHKVSLVLSNKNKHCNVYTLTD